MPDPQSASSFRLEPFVLALILGKTSMTIDDLESLSPAEKLAHCTVRIECEIPGGGLATGTGFYYTIDLGGGRSTPVIVTNKHVVRGTTAVRFLMTTQSEDGRPLVGTTFSVTVPDGERHWIPHPDPSIDLCALPMAAALRQIGEQGARIFSVGFDKSALLQEAEIADMTGVERVLMVGYPNGLWDRANNLPVFRRGMLATSYRYGWNGRREFLIDAACFPGSSGSPVLQFETGAYQSRRGLMFGGPRIKLLGVLYAGPQHSINGEVEIVEVPTRQGVFAAGIPNHLGIVIRADCLLDFEGELRGRLASPGS